MTLPALRAVLKSIDLISFDTFESVPAFAGKGQDTLNWLILDSKNNSMILS